MLELEGHRILLLLDWVAYPPLSELPRAVDLDTRKVEDLGWQVYRDADITGGTQGYQFAHDWQYLQQFEDGQLVIPKGGYAVELAPPLPREIRFRPEDQPDLLLSNRHLLAVANGQPGPKSPVGLGKLMYRVYDKSAKTWKSFPVPGNISRNVRAFGTWVAGMVDERAADERTRGVERKLNPPRISPGKEERDQSERPTGMPIDRFLEGWYYRPGILFLYHVPTARYYQFDTHQGDSEILLVEKDQVYYRVNRSIYQASIGETSIGKAALVVEGDEVPDIHWIFFGPKLPAGYKPPAGGR